MKAIKLQRGYKLHHYWLSQYIKAIVLHQREFEFEFWPIRKFHFIQPGPVPSTILNYCPIRWLLFHSPSWILVQSQAELPSWIIVQSEDCFLSAILHFWPIRDELPPHPPGIELSLLHYFKQSKFTEFVQKNLIAAERIRSSELLTSEVAIVFKRTITFALQDCAYFQYNTYDLFITFPIRFPIRSVKS